MGVWMHVCCQPSLPNLTATLPRRGRRLCYWLALYACHTVRMQARQLVGVACGNADQLSPAVLSCWPALQNCQPPPGPSPHSLPPDPLEIVAFSLTSRRRTLAGSVSGIDWRCASQRFNRTALVGLSPLQMPLLRVAALAFPCTTPLRL